MSFRRKGIPVIHRILIVLLSQLLMPVAGILEATANLWGFFTRNRLSFHVVEKQNFITDRQTVQEV